MNLKLEQQLLVSGFYARLKRWRKSYRPLRRLYQLAGNTGYGYVYFIWIEGMEWVKIGKSEKPWQRLQRLVSAEFPFDLIMLHYIRTDDYSILENALHRYFMHKRGRGEWFSLSVQDVVMMQQVTHIYFHKQNRIIVWPEQKYLPCPTDCDTLLSA